MNASASAKSTVASALRAATSVDTASPAAKMASIAAKMTSAAAATAAANAKSARATYRAAEVTLARVEAIQANIENAHTKISQASSKSIMHHTSEEGAASDVEMHVDEAEAEAMEPLPHEIFERELEMQEPSESDKLLEELRGAREEAVKCLSVEESAMRYQRELWRCHYYEYYNYEGNTNGEDVGVVEFILGDMKSSTSGISPG
ncbi:hypothetical protein ZWY2020_028477 [Hordeum vulgare]|nr:hypothetical protein ZWY2020_028477 [Hordeum vulgare]